MSVTTLAPGQAPVIGGRAYRFSKTDMGAEVWGRWAPIEAATRAVTHGLHFGYPPCCVEEFALDLLDGRLPSLRRGSLPDGNGGRYVPCSRCCDEVGRVTA